MTILHDGAGLRKEDRKAGPTWVLRHYVTRQSDGKRVEHKIPVGLVRDLKTESAAWAEVERQHLAEQINEPTSRNRVLFPTESEVFTRTTSTQTD